METRSGPWRSSREIERVSCWEFRHPRSREQDMHERSPEHSPPESGTRSNSKFEQETSTVIKIILVGIVSMRRSTLIFGPTPTEASTRSYGASKKWIKELKGSTWTNTC